MPRSQRAHADQLESDFDRGSEAVAIDTGKIKKEEPMTEQNQKQMGTTLRGSIAEMARTQDGELLHTLQKAFDFIENESFASTFQGLFSEINLNSEKLGKQYTDRNANAPSSPKLPRG